MKLGKTLILLALNMDGPDPLYTEKKNLINFWFLQGLFDQR